MARIAVSPANPSTIFFSSTDAVSTQAKPLFHFSFPLHPFSNILVLQGGGREGGPRQVTRTAMGRFGGSGGGYYRPSQGSGGGSRRNRGDTRTADPDYDAAIDLDRIQSNTVRLLDQEQNMIGVVSINEAIQMADDAELVLAILSPDADPPVLRLFDGMDYKKHKYEQQKRKRDQQKRSAANRVDIKELKMGYNIDSHDYSVRLRAAKKFLKDGDKVKIIVNLKGRENEFRNIAIELIKRFQNDVGETDEGIFISQKKYAADILKHFKMASCNPIKTPVEARLSLDKIGNGEFVNSTYYRSLVGCLRYLTSIRPDIVYGVGLISRFMETPSQSHLQVAGRILRYIKGTQSHGILYSSADNCDLVGYTDSDWAGDMEERKSTSGYVFHMGSGVFSWSSKKQQVVALSTTEAEYMAVASSACQAVWLRRLLEELNQKQESPTKIYCDNKSAIALAKNPVFHGRSKHIGIKYHYIRELVEDKEIELEFCKSEDQVADILTKPLKAEAFYRLKKMMGMSYF